MDDPTAQLRAQARAGDAEAFGAVFDACAKSVYNHAFRLTGDWSAAEEIMAMTFLEAWRGRDRIAADVSGRLDDVARIEALHRALADLPGPELEVLALCVWSGASYADAAEALHTPVGTIRSRLSRARAKLARLTDGELRRPEHADLDARFATPRERDLPPGRHELHREILMNHMLTESGRAPARHRRPRRRMLAIGGTAGFGIAAAAVAVTLIATSTARPPGAPSRPVAGGPAASHSATSAASSPLVLLADTITASVNKQPGDATLIFRSTTFTDGTAPGSGYDLYTDSGPYYWSPTKSGLPGQVAGHHSQGDGLFTREIAAAEYAVHGNLAIARERMADAPDPSLEGKSPAAQMSPRLLEAKAQMLGVKPAPGQSLAAAYDKAYMDNWVWGDATDALEAGAGNPLVRAGVLRLLSTVAGVVVTQGTLDGQSTLVVGDVTPSLNGNGTSEGAMTLNASTGIPLEYTDGAVGQAPDSTTTYQVSRVTVADILAGKF